MFNPTVCLILQYRLMDDPFLFNFISFAGIGDSFASIHLEEVAIAGGKPAVSTTAADKNGSRMVLSIGFLDYRSGLVGKVFGQSVVYLLRQWV